MFYILTIGGESQLFFDTKELARVVLEADHVEVRKFATESEARAFADECKRKRGAPEPAQSSSKKTKVDPESNNHPEPGETAKKAAVKHGLLYFDGGSRGNGHAGAVAGAGYVVYPVNTRTAIEGHHYMGNATNNEAEYTGMIWGMRAARNEGITHLLVRGDSELAIKQMRGEYRVKAGNLKSLYELAKSIQKEFAEVSFEHVRRESNARADELSNVAMSKKTSGETTCVHK